jgi:SAM-dependent methyltransferase
LETPAYRRRKTCRLCDKEDVVKVLSLVPTPLANAFVAADELSQPQDVYPLDLWLCNGCGHVQLLDVVDPKVLYKHYVYVSGTSPSFVRHFEDYSRYLLGTFPVPAGSLAVDIGSNDGTLLKCLKAAGLNILGIDPAEEIGEASRKAGIPTITAFFTQAVAERVVKEHGHAKFVTANNVIAHIDDLSEVMRGVQHLLAPDGIFAFEVAYLADTLEKTLFDTVYHEHLDYHSVEPFIPFFKAHGLELIEAMRVDTHGGSIRGVVQRAGGPRKPGASLAALLRAEQALGLRKPATYRDFNAHIDQVGRDLTALLKKLSGEGKRIAGFGAPAKLTTLLYQFRIDPKLLDFIIDDSPLKQGKYTPGMHIPVVPAQALYERKPDYVVVLAWNFARPIMEKHAKFLEDGGHFIIPLPSIEVI